MSSAASTVSPSLRAQNISRMNSRSTENGTSSVLSPQAIGLLLEFGILPVAFGNLLVLLSLGYHKKVIVTDIFLFSLSLADFVDAIFPLQILIFMNYLVHKPWTRVLCDIFVVVVNSLRLTSAGTVTLMAMERTYLLVFPLKYHIKVTKSKARKTVAVVWFVSFLLGLLPLIGVGHSGFNSGQCLYQFYFLGRVNAIVLLTVSFLLLVCVLFCFIIIKFSGEKFIQRQRLMAAGKHITDASKVATRAIGVGNDSEQKRTSIAPMNKTKGIKEVRRLTAMMTTVIILYYVSFIPVLISNVVILVQQKSSSKAVIIGVGVMSLLYALCNPIIYGKMSPRYLRGYQLVVGNVLGFCGYRPRSFSTATTSQSTPNYTNDKDYQRRKKSESPALTCTAEENSPQIAGAHMNTVSKDNDSLSGTLKLGVVDLKQSNEINNDIHIEDTYL